MELALPWIRLALNLTLPSFSLIRMLWLELQVPDMSPFHGLILYVCSSLEFYYTDVHVCLPVSFLKKPHFTFLKNSSSGTVLSSTMPSGSVLEWHVLEMLPDPKSHIPFRKVFPGMFWQTVSGSLLRATSSGCSVGKLAGPAETQDPTCYSEGWKGYRSPEKLLLMAAEREHRVCHPIGGCI